MNKIIDGLYIGERREVQARKEVLIKEGIMFPVDVGVHFDKEQIPYSTVWDFTWGILDLIEHGRVLLYCEGGTDRSPFIATMVVKLYHGATWEEAWDIVSKARPQAFHHDDWERMVENFE